MKFGRTCLVLAVMLFSLGTAWSDEPPPVAANPVEYVQPSCPAYVGIIFCVLLVGGFILLPNTMGKGGRVRMRDHSTNNGFCGGGFSKSGGFSSGGYRGGPSGPE